VSSSYPPDVKHQERFRAAEQLARAENKGLWAGCGGADLPIDPTPPSASPDQQRSCDASYPSVCIPPYPPDLDCGQIQDRRFQVIPPDPHGFDGDFDKIGCERG
jgi:hypothetical protein